MHVSVDHYDWLECGIISLTTSVFSPKNVQLFISHNWEEFCYMLVQMLCSPFPEGETNSSLDNFIWRTKYYRPSKL